MPSVVRVGGLFACLVAVVEGWRAGWGEADDFDCPRSEVGHHAVEVGRVAYDADQPGSIGPGVVHVELVEERLEQAFGGLAPDHDLVGRWLVHGFHHHPERCEAASPQARSHPGETGPARARRHSLNSPNFPRVAVWMVRWGRPRSTR